MNTRCCKSVGAITLMAAVVTVMAMQSGPQGDDSCRGVLGELQVMQSELVEMDRVMDARVSQMHAASEAERLDAMTRVIDALVEQRAVERRAMKGTHQKMVVHLMRHMMEGGYGSGGDFDECVIMRQMIREDYRSDATPDPGPLER